MDKVTAKIIAELTAKIAGLQQRVSFIENNIPYFCARCGVTVHTFCRVCEKSICHKCETSNIYTHGGPVGDLWCFECAKKIIVKHQNTKSQPNVPTPQYVIYMEYITLDELLQRKQRLYFMSYVKPELLRNSKIDISS